MLFRFFKVFPNADAFEFCFYILKASIDWEKHKYLHLGTLKKQKKHNFLRPSALPGSFFGKVIYISQYLTWYQESSWYLPT